MNKEKKVLDLRGLANWRENLQWYGRTVEQMESLGLTYHKALIATDALISVNRLREWAKENDVEILWDKGE